MFLASCKQRRWRTSVHKEIPVYTGARNVDSVISLGYFIKINHYWKELVVYHYCILFLTEEAESEQASQLVRRFCVRDVYRLGCKVKRRCTGHPSFGSQWDSWLFYNCNCRAAAQISIIKSDTSIIGDPPCKTSPYYALICIHLCVKRCKIVYLWKILSGFRAIYMDK